MWSILNIEKRLHQKLQVGSIEVNILRTYVSLRWKQTLCLISSSLIDHNILIRVYTSGPEYHVHFVNCHVSHCNSLNVCVFAAPTFPCSSFTGAQRDAAYMYQSHWQVKIVNQPHPYPTIIPHKSHARFVNFVFTPQALWADSRHRPLDLEQHSGWAMSL